MKYQTYHSSQFSPRFTNVRLQFLINYPLLASVWAFVCLPTLVFGASVWVLSISVAAECKCHNLWTVHDFFEHCGFWLHVAKLAVVSPCQSLMQEFQEWIKEIKHSWLCSYHWTVSRWKTFFHCKLLEVSVWDHFFGPTTGNPWMPNPEEEENDCQILKETQQVWFHHHINPHLSQFCCMASLSDLFKPLLKKKIKQKCVKIWLGQAGFQFLVQVQ